MSGWQKVTAFGIGCVTLGALVSMGAPIEATAVALGAFATGLLITPPSARK